MTLSVLDAASEFPDRTALVIGDGVVSYARLAKSARRAISWLASTGLTRSADPVALVGASDLPTLEIVYALIEIGLPVALVHPRLTGPERKPLLDLFPRDRVLDAHAATRHVDGGRAPPERRPPDESILAIVFTSGTTGRPKGVALSHRAFIASARASEQNLKWQDGDRWLLGLPIAHVGGLSILTRCLIARRTVVVAREVTEGRRLDASAIARAIEVYRVTLASLVPTQLEWLLSPSSSWRPPKHLRAVLLGGAPARPALLARAADLGVPVVTTYGLTEACSQVTTQVLGTVNRGELGAGAPVAGTEVRIGADGGVEVRGATLLSGYFPASSIPAIAPDGWFATDDVGRFDANGHLHIVGRRSECIITGGENVFPSEVEAALEECPGVARACAFGVPDDTWGEVVAVAIVPTGPDTLPALAEFARARLAPHRRPRLVAVVEALETNAAGKLDRRGTRELARERLSAIRY